jgi:membrane fusion protein (multidrug efflux system)
MNPSGTTEPAAMPPAGEPAASTSEAAATASTKLRHAAIVAAVLIVLATVAGLVPRWLHRKALRAETRELAIQTVNLVSPVPGKAAAGLILPAEAKALVEAPIYARTTGYVKRYLVDIGAQVKAGDLLAQIDAPEQKQELAQAEGQLAQAEAALMLARTTAARWADLLKTSSVSEQEAAEKKADLDLKSATVAAAQANVHRLEELRSFGLVTAPFAGTITARGTDVGQLVTASNGKELFRLAQTGTLRVYVRVPQSAAQGVAVGQMAELTVPELPGRVFPAKVVRTSGAMSTDSRTLLTELQVDNSRGEILAGTYVQVRLTDAKVDPALTLPANTLLFRSEGPQVGLVGADGKVELHSVTLGRDFGPTIEVLGGVGSTDRVILNPADSLVGGTTVRVAEAAKEPAGKAAATAASAK